MALSFLWSLASIQPSCAANFLLAWDASTSTNVVYRIYQSSENQPYNLSGTTTNLSVVSSNVVMTIMTRWYVTAIRTVFATDGTSVILESLPSNVVTNLPTVIPPPAASPTFEAESGALTSPFYATNGFVQQDIGSGLTNGGRALYPFTITNAGNYTVNILINAPGDAANSIFLNIDAEPTDPAMIWDIPLTAGFQFRTAAWRGAGTFDANQFVPKSWTLANGAHTLIIRGREAGVQLDRVTIAPVTVTNVPPPMPPPAVSNLRATQITSTRLDLQWESSPPMKVQVWKVTGTSQFQIVKTLDAGILHWSDNSIRKGKEYNYKVCAVSFPTCSNTLFVSTR